MTSRLSDLRIVAAVDDAGTDLKPADEDEDGVVIAIRGKATAVTDVRLVDADGEQAGVSWFSFEHEGETLRSFRLRRPLEPTDRLELDLATGQETITVPFDLKDVPLP